MTPEPGERAQIRAAMDRILVLPARQGGRREHEDEARLRAASRLAQSFGWQLSLAGPVVLVGLDQGTDPAALSPGQIDAILEKTRTPSLAGGDDVAGEAR